MSEQYMQDHNGIARQMITFKPVNNILKYTCGQQHKFLWDAELYIETWNGK